jgi:hypothetical protein
MTWSGPSGAPDGESPGEPAAQPQLPPPLPGYAQQPSAPPGNPYARSQEGGRAPVPWLDPDEPDVSSGHVLRLQRRLRRAQIVISVLAVLLVAACAWIVVLLVS